MIIDQKIGEFLHKKSPKGDLGIEIEAEFKGNLHEIGGDYWRTVADGSLRNGLEFVSRLPVPYKELSAAMQSYADQTKGFSFVESIRTSVHLHVNACSNTFRDVIQSSLCYWLIENLLVETQGEYRKGNLYCLRGKDADAMVARLCYDITDSLSKENEEKLGGRIAFLREEYRYAGPN